MKSEVATKASFKKRAIAERNETGLFARLSQLRIRVNFSLRKAVLDGTKPSLIDFFQLVGDYPNGAPFWKADRDRVSPTAQKEFVRFYWSMERGKRTSLELSQLAYQRHIRAS